jgi:hypothetical protein
MEVTVTHCSTAGGSSKSNDFKDGTWYLQQRNEHGARIRANKPPHDSFVGCLCVGSIQHYQLARGKLELEKRALESG